MKNILIIMGHPNPESLCNSLADSYAKGAQKAGAKVTMLRLFELDFDPILHKGYQQRQELEPDLLNAQKLITAANHIVWVYPNWWATVPALLKGFIDRTFVPGFAFGKYEEKLLPTKLLKNKTGHLIVTSDTPGFFYRLFLRAPGHAMMKLGVLGFVGIKPVKITTIATVKTSLPAKREKWLTKIQHLGYKMK